MVLEGESLINTAEREIDEAAFDLLAMQQPMAVDLRFILAVTKINSDLERVGDQAVNIAERVMDMVELPAAELPVDIARMGAAVSAMVRRALESFIEGKAELAQAVLEMDNVIDRMRDDAFIQLVKTMNDRPEVVRQALDALLVARNLERVADHATNIAEDVIFWVQGSDVRHNARTEESEPANQISPPRMLRAVTSQVEPTKSCHPEARVLCGSEDLWSCRQLRRRRRSQRSLRQAQGRLFASLRMTRVRNGNSQSVEGSPFDHSPRLALRSSPLLFLNVTSRRHRDSLSSSFRVRVVAGARPVLAQSPAADRPPIMLPSSKMLEAPSPGRIGSTNSFPATMVVSPDGDYAALLNDGYGTQETLAHQSISVLDLKTNQIVEYPDARLSDTAHQSYFIGLAFSSDGKHLYASVGSLSDPTGAKPGDTGNGIAVYSFSAGKVAPERFIPIALQPLPTGKKLAVGLKAPPHMAIPYPAGLDCDFRPRP